MRANYFHKFKTFHFISFLILISLCFSGSDCEKILENNQNIPSDIIGDWILVTQTGALQDICPDENVKFQSTGTALLSCPNSTVISRDYTIQDNVLNYTQAGISYSIQNLTADSLYLLGQNVSRNLLYLKIIASDKNSDPNLKETDFINSSEIRK